MMHPSREAGMTMVGWLIGSVLSLLLIATVIQVYLSEKRTFQYGVALSNIHHLGVSVLTTLSHHIEKAGFVGCGRFFKSHHTSPLPLSLRQGFLLHKSFSGGWEPSLPTWLKQKVKPGSDAIEIVYATAGFARFQSKSQLGTIKVNTLSQFKKGQSILINDCIHAEQNQVQAFQKNNQTVGNLTLAQSLHGHYEKGALVSPIAHHLVYLGKSLMHCVYRGTEPHCSAMADHIKSLKLAVHPNKTMQLSMLTLSNPGITTGKSTYQFQGQSFNGRDQRLYYEWSTTIPLYGLGA